MMIYKQIELRCHSGLLLAQTKVINETFLKLFAAKAQPYFKKLWADLHLFVPEGQVHLSYLFNED
jgi:hypothetical protein